MCRTLSLSGCTFNVIEDSVAVNSLKIYDNAAALWQELLEELLEEFNAEGYFDRFHLNDEKENNEMDSDDSEDEDDYDETKQTLNIPFNKDKPLGQRDHALEGKQSQAITRYNFCIHVQYTCLFTCSSINRCICKYVYVYLSSFLYERFCS